MLELQHGPPLPPSAVVVASARCWSVPEAEHALEEEEEEEEEEEDEAEEEEEEEEEEDILLPGHAASAFLVCLVCE